MGKSDQGCRHQARQLGNTAVRWPFAINVLLSHPPSPRVLAKQARTMTRCGHGIPWSSHLMSEAYGQHRTGIALIVAAAIAWSTAPLFTHLLHYDSWTILFW